MASAIKKVHMIPQIVRLKHVVQQWKAKSLTRRHSATSSDSDGPDAPVRRRVPSGSIAVYVGTDRIRFVIPTRFLNLPVFVALLRQAEEEFGFQSSGGLVLPCEPGFFDGILRLLKGNEERFRGLSLDEFRKMGFEPWCSSTCKESTAASSSNSSCLSFTPLLAKSRAG